MHTLIKFATHKYIFSNNHSQIYIKTHANTHWKYTLTNTYPYTHIQAIKHLYRWTHSHSWSHRHLLRHTHMVRYTLAHSEICSDKLVLPTHKDWYSNIFWRAQLHTHKLTVTYIDTHVQTCAHRLAHISTHIHTLTLTNILTLSPLHTHTHT